MIFSRFITMLAGCLALASDAAPVQSMIAQDSFPDSIRETFPLSELSKTKLDGYTLRHGRNVMLDASFAGNAQQRYLMIKTSIKDVTATSPSGNWFNISHAIISGPEWENADGIALQAGTAVRGTSWMSLDLETDAGSFSQVMTPNNFSMPDTLIYRLFPFSKFKNKDGKILDKTKVCRLTLGNGVINNIIYLGKFFLYRERKDNVPVIFWTNRPRTSIFEPGEIAELSFSCPGNVSGIEVCIKNYFGKVCAQYRLTDKKNKDGSSIFQCKFTPSAPGYYEVSAWPFDQTGKRLVENSAIQAEGSRPQGKGTFAVMPRTIAENARRSEKLGENAFFGLHGNYEKLADYLGVTWHIAAYRWINHERSGKPVRPDHKEADWCADAIRTTRPVPASQRSIVHLSVNLPSTLPEWARRTPAERPPAFSREDFELFFRDLLKLYRATWPSQRTRLYDISWEVNLNVPELMVKPYYTPADVVACYRWFRPLLKKLDPAGQVIGPCPASLSGYSWLETLLKEGLGKELDAFHFHGYHAPPPEKSDVPGKIRQLRKLLDASCGGRKLDMYCSELGFQSRYDMSNRVFEHAQWHVRTAIILKGEGVKVHMPFYGYDARNSSYGLTYTLDPKQSYTPPAVAPKPAFPALAVCVDQLEGTSPVGDLPWFGSDVYGYFFRNGDETILAVWTVEAPQTIRLPAGTHKVPLEAIDMMGAHSRIVPKNGYYELALSPSVLYLRNLPTELYGNGVKSEFVREYPFPGPSATPIGQTGLHLTATSPNRWISIRTPVEISRIVPRVSSDGKFVDVTLVNRADKTLEIQIQASSLLFGRFEKSVQLSPRKETIIPIKVLNNASARAEKVRIEAATPGSPIIRREGKINYLAAHRPNRVKLKNELPDTVKWTSSGSCGQRQSAKAVFQWDASGLSIVVTTDDKHFQQPFSGENIWRGDSLQIAFDTDPDRDDLYNPLGGIFSKKMTSLAFAKTDSGHVVKWRHQTHNPAELKTGELGPELEASVHFDPAAGTVYRIRIPWKEIGFATPPQPGKMIGIDLLVNDLDPKGERCGLELFGGIMRSLHYSNFGNLLLE